ncbi:MAG: hypothetical protein L0Z50_10850 [Verrucomicrobiales bacterium]|nr:hypothetical protein [Verrucomicrobiales bacterium]
MPAPMAAAMPTRARLICSRQMSIRLGTPSTAVRSHYRHLGVSSRHLSQAHPRGAALGPAGGLMSTNSTSDETARSSGWTSVTRAKPIVGKNQHSRSTLYYCCQPPPSAL